MSAHVFLTGYPGWLAEGLLAYWKKAPLKHLTLLVEPKFHAHPGQFDALPFPVTVVSADLCDSSSYAAALQGVDQVIHAAGVIHPPLFHVHEYKRVNVQGTRALGEIAARAQVRRFVFISSNAAGGRASGTDQLSESDPDHPISMYGKSKKEAESALLALSGLDTVILRPCMFYGPPVPARHQEIFARIASGRMPVFGSLDPQRSVVHVENLVQAVEKAREIETPSSRIYYIADAEPTTYRGYCESIARPLGSTIRWIELPTFLPRVALVLDRLLSRIGLYWQTLHLVGEADWNASVSIEGAKKELGYAPQRTLQEGMEEAVRWYKNQKNGAGRGVDWTAIHDPNDSYRKKLVGEILETYVLPKYRDLFLKSFEGESNQTFVEIGAGNGDTSEAVLGANAERTRKNLPPLVQSYLATEVFPDGVKWLKKRGLHAELANAEKLPFADASFDHAVAFDVMHHVDRPERMAHEMLRVSRGKLLLTESNGLSVPRKLLELLPNRRRAGERSYTPWAYRSFFTRHPEFEITEFNIRPFLFVIGVPRALNPLLVRFSEWIEWVPFLKWQCSTVLIEVHFRRKKS